MGECVNALQHFETTFNYRWRRKHERANAGLTNQTPALLIQPHRLAQSRPRDSQILCQFRLGRQTLACFQRIDPLAQRFFGAGVEGTCILSNFNFCFHGYVSHIAYRASRITYHASRNMLSAIHHHFSNRIMLFNHRRQLHGLQFATAHDELPIHHHHIRFSGRAKNQGGNRIVNRATGELQ